MGEGQFGFEGKHSGAGPPSEKFTLATACGMGDGQFGVEGRHKGAGPPSEKFATATVCGIGDGQLGVEGKHRGAGPPSENPTVALEFLEAAIPETAARTIKPASKVVASDFINLSLSLLLCMP